MPTKPTTRAKAGAKREHRDEDEPRARRSGTVALVGRPNVGKSTLLNAMLGERIAITSRHAQTTRDRIAGILTEDDVQIVFFDTPGLHQARHRLGERMNDVALETASACDVAIFMTDGGVKDGGESGAVSAAALAEDRRILAQIPASTPTVCVFNKIDRIRPKERLFPILEAYGKERDFAAVVPLAAIRADGKDRLFKLIASLLPDGEFLYPEDEISDKPVRFFVAEYVREQILERTRQEVPHGIAVDIEAFEDTPKIARITLTVHVAKDSHKGIIIGSGGKMLTAIGRAARARAEALLGKQIHLETRVRATPGWFDDAGRLEDFGYVGDGKAKAKASTKPKSKSKSTHKARHEPKPRDPKASKPPSSAKHEKQKRT